jgi:hypothetical protein
MSKDFQDYANKCLLCQIFSEILPGALFFFFPVPNFSENGFSSDMHLRNYELVVYDKSFVRLETSLSCVTVSCSV